MVIGGFILLRPGHFGLELCDFGLDCIGHYFSWFVDYCCETRRMWCVLVVWLIKIKVC
jgi:hypothetical protein